MGNFKFCFWKFPGIFFLNIFDLCLVESEDVEPVDMESQLCVGHLLFIADVPVSAVLVPVNSTSLFLLEVVPPSFQIQRGRGQAMHVFQSVLIVIS